MILGIFKLFRTVILPTTKNLSKRCIAMILTADMLFTSLLGAFATPLYAWARTIPDNPENHTVGEIGPDDEMENNWGTVTVNNGTIKNNVGTVSDNNGVVQDNYGTVTDDPATHSENRDVGQVNTNHKESTVNGGIVIDNFGTVNNSTYVTNNYSSGTVNGSNECQVDNNAGTVTNAGLVINNYGTVAERDPEITITNNHAGEEIPAALNRTDTSTAPTQPDPPTPFDYEPPTYYEESNVETDDSSTATPPVLNAFEKMLLEDKGIAGKYGLEADAVAVVLSDNNMKNSTLYVTLEKAGSVSIVNLGAQPNLSADMIQAMLDHGGYFGFIAGGEYVILNFSNTYLRNSLISVMDELHKTQGKTVTDEGKNDSAYHVADPSDIAESAGTIKDSGAERPAIDLSAVTGVKGSATGEVTTGENQNEAPGMAAYNAVDAKTVDVNQDARKTVAVQDSKLSNIATCNMKDGIDASMSWWWIIVVLVLGEAGRELYLKWKEKKEGVMIE